MAVGDPAHDVNAEQDAGTDLECLDHGVLVNVDDVGGAPDERVEARADAVSIEDDEAPGHLHQDREQPLHAGQRQAVDARGDMTMDCRTGSAGRGGS